MNKHIPLILLAAALLLLSGCQKDAPDAGSGLPMHVAPTLAGDTKGSLTTADLTDFYLQVISDDAAYSYFEHASKDGSGAWTTPTALRWKNEKASVTYGAARFGSYAFTQEDFENSVNLEVPADQSSQERLNAADLLTMAAASRTFDNTTDGTLPVTLAHGLAKLTIIMTFAPVFYDNYYCLDTNPIQDFKLNDAVVGFRFTPKTGAVTALDGKDDVRPLELSFSPATADAKISRVVYEAILVPQDFAAGELKATFSVDEMDYEWFNFSAISLAAGKTYDLEISVTDAPSQNAPYVKMGDGLRWAAWNVGATSLGQNGEYYAWAEVAPKGSYAQGTYIWQQPGIDLFYNITKYTFADGNDLGANWYSGEVFVGDGKTDFADYAYADDAARRNWGRSWRTPTPAEWQWLADNCTWEWQTDYLGTGTKGMLVTSTVAGFAGNSIFLPAAGYLRNESCYSYGTEGAYWSSSLSENDVTYAKYLDFDKTSGPSMTTSTRYRGFSVRPVCN